MNIYHGIRYSQGTTGISNQDAAGNTFSSNGIYNFYNGLNSVKYVHHESATPYGIKIIPDPRTISTVALQRNNNTTYLKSISCPSKLSSDTKEVLSMQVATADSGILVAKTQLASFTDGGNTTELNSNVQSAQSSTSYPLFEELIATSPYLSDTVMKSGIENTAALPDAMLRDVLVANPQSAKSGEVMQALDLRIVPLPDEMKAEVQEGINIYASYDQMLGNLALWNDLYSNANTGLARIFAGDSIATRAADSLAVLFSTTNTAEAKYNLALLEMARGNALAAQQALSTVANTFNLTNDEFALHLDYLNVVDKVNTLSQYANSILNADSSALMQLQPITLKDAWMPGAISRNILHSAGYLEYTEPINLTTSLKTAKTSNPGNSQSNNTNLQNFGLEIYPNPASDYCIVHYTCTTEGNNLLQITDIHGKPLESIRLKGRNNSVVVTLQKYAAGNYMVSLIHYNTPQKSDS